MTSPFPGMDPFLEFSGLWSDFHAKFINYWQEAISASLPETYEAHIGERFNLFDVAIGPVRQVEPDVALTHRGGDPISDDNPAVATLEPVTIPNLVQSEFRETFIEIVHRPDRRLVAILELLSPGNKAGTGLPIYLKRRFDILFQDVHLFELDLLLSGKRPPLERPLPPGDYYAFLSRTNHDLECEVYAWPLEHKLPTLPIPLLPPDPDITIDYAAVFALTYERGRYARSLDYRTLPNELRGEGVRVQIERMLKNSQP